MKPTTAKRIIITIAIITPRITTELDSANASFSSAVTTTISCFLVIPNPAYFIAPLYSYLTASSAGILPALSSSTIAFTHAFSTGLPIFSWSG